jgi:hypothetical protein
MRHALCALLLFGALACETPAQAEAPSASATLGVADQAGLTAYESVRVALLADAPTDAALAARGLAAVPGLDPALVAAAGALASAPDLAGQRRAFGELSRLFVLRVATAESPKLYYFDCPMVTEGFGGWIQPARGIGNPYMGASMPRCGSEIGARAALKDAQR